MRTISALLLASLLVGCGALEREKAKLMGHSAICVDGVEYLQFPSGVTVAYGQDGKVRTCK